MDADAQVIDIDLHQQVVNSDVVYTPEPQLRGLVFLSGHLAVSLDNKILLSMERAA